MDVRPFSETIKDILHKFYGKNAEDIFNQSSLLQYLEIKTRSANRGAKARGSFANIYAIYVVVEDYINKGYETKSNYRKHYEGAQFQKLLARVRSLPFGAKIQNHGLNGRANDEFRKYFPEGSGVPIPRDQKAERYWLNENLLKISIGRRNYNIARPAIAIIDAYVKTKKQAFESFLAQCQKLKAASKKDKTTIIDFVTSLLAPNVDARIFEIVSYSILKSFYHNQKIYWGFDKTSIKEDSLTLYKTGRTNANDGGIDFVMKPLGRFFQVTETIDPKKYFLDIDKVQRYPITFVIKSEQASEEIRKRFYESALKQYGVERVANAVLNCIEEIINLPQLRSCLSESVKKGYKEEIFDEIIRQSKVEFNF